MARVLVLVAATALAAGCGGGSKRLSHAEFRAKGNAICRNYDKKIDAIPQPRGIDDLESYVERAKKLTQDAVDKLDELEPPESAEQDFDEFLARSRDELDLVDDLEAAAKDRDEARIRTVAKKGDKLEKRANAAARRAGLSVCGRET